MEKKEKGDQKLDNQTKIITCLSERIMKGILRKSSLDTGEMLYLNEERKFIILAGTCGGC